MNILDRNKDYPQCFFDNQQGYFIFEYVSNLSLDEAELKLTDIAYLEKNIICKGRNEENFYKFIVSKYNKWKEVNYGYYSYYSDSRFTKEEVSEITEDIGRINNIVFELLVDGRCSKLIYYIITELRGEYLSSSTPETLSLNDNVQERGWSVVYTDGKQKI